MQLITRKEFLAQVGAGALSFPVCLGMLTGCSESPANPAPPTNVDFTLDISSGPLSVNGGFIVTSGLVVARTKAGAFLAVSAACPHEGTAVEYVSANNDFYCPSHGSVFSATGQVQQGPASSSLAKYNTSLSGKKLRVFS